MKKDRHGMIKRPLALLLTVILVFSCLGGAVTVSAEEAHSHDDLTFAAWTSTTSLPTSAGNYYLASDVTISSTWNVPSGTTNLCLNGHGIRMTGTGSVIYIAGGAALNLYDCDETTEHKFTVSDSAANGAGVATVDDALTENYQTFTGGYITGGNANPYGGGVRVEKTGKFNMYGGTIIGNKASSHGGGVSASGAGQGVSNTKNFVMSGGAICYNAAGWGGGIGVYGEVYISGNSVISKNTASAGGAGIELESNGRLYLDGGNITENLLLDQNGGMWKGAGVHVPGGSEFHIKGTTQVTNNYQSNGTTQNNVFVRSGQKVTVDDMLAENARIGIALQDTTGAFTSGLSGKGSAKNFVSDNNTYGVILKDNEAQIGVIAASVTTGGTTEYYESLSNAIGAWVDGSTLKLFQNTGMQITVGSGTRTLDLNGHNISRSGTVIVATNANLTLTDSSASPGTLSNTSTGGGSVVERNGGTLTMSNIKATSKYNGMGLTGCTATIYSGQISVTSSWKTIFNVGDGSNLTVYDGTFQSANHMVAYLTGSGAATFEGGSFKGSFSNTAVVHGGYYDRDVSNLCPEGYACVASDDTSKGAYMIKMAHLHDGISFEEWTSTNSLPTTAGNYYLASDVTISSTWELPSGTTNLCLNGHGIEKTGTGSVIKVGEGRTLKIYDCDTTTEHRYSVASPATNGAGVATVNDALTSGYQTFKGGYITGGYITGGYQYGAGINLEGNGATLYMYGGTIIGNRLTAGSTGGGGVCVQDWDKSGGFYMYGGSIIGNTSNYGGGVYVRSGKMELIGGNISKNVANGNIGGGVLVFGGNSTLIVEGGSISDNKAVHGGAVEASGDGTVIISGGSFTNNLATGKGGALTNQRTDGDTSPASFSISGSPVFSGNTAGGQSSDIYLCNTAVLNLTAALTNTTKIGIRKASTTGAITSGWSTYMTDGEGKVADPADYFVSENGNYVVKLVDSEAKIAPPHDHDWSYSADGNVIKASCVGTTGTCDLISPQTLTITATGKTYDGSAVTASVTKSANWDAYGLATPGDIVYSGNTNAGTYTASVTAGGATASVEFTIAQAPLTVTATAQTKVYGEDDPTFTYTASGLIGTDTLSGELSRAAGDNVGTYAITQGTLTAGGNYDITYTGANLTITEATMTGIIASGYTGDYDGDAHSISVTVPDGATVDYGTAEGEYTLSENPTYTDAGTYTVYYKISKANYFTVYGSQTVTINQINATVTITGHNATVDYDGEAHEVTGYDAVADTNLYDVTKDFTFSGDATAAQTNAGTAYMGLAAEQFANTNANFATVTFVIADGYQTVNQINATVTITGHNSTVDYDGTEHTITGYDAVADTDLYDVTKDFTFSGNATASQTNAGTTYMGLAAEQFANTNANFATVTFVIADGYQTVNQINATVTITGHIATVDYNGEAQELGGYDAVADTKLYDVKKDFVFTGSETVVVIDAGITYMCLVPRMFANVNPNFAVVTFEITDGYLEVLPVDAVVVSAPQAIDPAFDDSEQVLIVTGQIEGGTIYYALGADGENAPADSSYSKTLPSAKNAGFYYVWYKVKGDDNHKDLPPVCVRASIVENTWGTLQGILYRADGETPLEGALVTLTKGNQTVKSNQTGSDGKYQFDVPAGVYNLIVETEQNAVTVLVTVSEETTRDLSMPNGKTESYVKVNTGDQKAQFEVVVGGLDDEARLIRSADEVSEEQSVSVVMTVEQKKEGADANTDAIRNLAKDKTLDFFEIKVEKTVDSVATVLDETATVLEIVVPYANAGKNGITVYSYHDGEVRTFAESETKASGTFRVDAENCLVYIYSNSFSTYAIGYTPSYRVNATISLGSFRGTATVILKNIDSGSTFTFAGVAMGKAAFEGIPKGEYQMTVTWDDGVKNTITMPLTVEAKEIAPVEVEEAETGVTAAGSALDPQEALARMNETQNTSADRFALVLTFDDPKARLPKELQF